MNAPLSQRQSVCSRIDPVVVVGSGPVGLRAVQTLRRQRPKQTIVWYGAEPWQPYNRIKLTPFLAGELDWSELVGSLAIPESVDCRFGQRVTAIDRPRSLVIDAAGVQQPYATLVLATGSRAHIPAIPGVELPGVFTFRSLDDAQKLQARTVRSRATVVIGGGLLGLEAARAVRRFNTRITVVEHAQRLMPRQLDAAAARQLQAGIEAMGLEVRIGEGVRSINGDGRVESVSLRDGGELECDTVIVATGILPNVELALASSLAVGKGIRVDDSLRTADPSIYAIGECAEHRGTVYGLVAPGLEQAAVCATNIGGGNASYQGSTAATNLKVMGCKVFSVGDVEPSGPADIAVEIAFSEAGSYRKLLLRQGRLAGAIGIGEWPERSRLQEAVRKQRFVWPLQRMRFRREGRLWPEEGQADVQFWPSDATVCNCTGITKGALVQAVQGGCNSVESLCAGTGAGSVCGSCRPLLAELAGATALPAQAGARKLWIATLAAALFGLIYALFSIPFPDTAELGWRWDAIWRDKLIKQISGYTTLSLMASLAVLSLRKRWSRLTRWDFGGWRLVHVLLGTALAIALLAHTGGRLGDSLDFAMSLSAITAIASGVTIATLLARQHLISPRTVRSGQRLAVWGHILSLWLLPTLLAFHILKTYYF